MRHWFFYAALALAWASPIGASPTCKAMVLKVSGPATAHPYPKTNDRVITGQIWGDGCVVDVPAGSTVTLLLLSQGERVEVTGKGTLRITPAGLVLKGCTSRPLTSNQHQLSLSGENHRQIGGMTLRGGNPKDLQAKLDRVNVTPTNLKVSCPAGAGEPPSLQFRFTDYYSQTNLNKELNQVSGYLENVDISPLSPVNGRLVDDRWEWEIGWPPAKTPQAVGLVAYGEVGQPWLYTRVHVPIPEEEQQLATAKEDALKWSEQEPGSAQPWLVYAAFLEEKGHLEEAKVVVDRVLRAQPKDEGLIQMKARLLMDLGRYLEAANLLKANRPKKPQ